ERQEVYIDRLRYSRRATGIVERPTLFAQDSSIDAERRDQVHGAADGLADDQNRPQDAPVPILALLQLAKKALLRPIEVRLLVHFGAVFPRRHREWADVDGLTLGA